MTTPTSTLPSAEPLWVAMTHHGAHLLECEGVESLLLDNITPEVVKGRVVIVTPSAAKPGAEAGAERRLRAMGAAKVAMVTPELLQQSGASDCADLIETAHTHGRTPRLDVVGALALEQERTANERAQSNDSSIRLIRGSNVEPEPINWLWRDWLARGKLHIIAGAPGTGKTTIAIAFAATVTTGGRWPDGTRTEPGNVLIWSGEDDRKDTLLPRLIAMGADPSRVYFVGDVLADGNPRPFDPARDMPALERETARVGDVRLLIVDPIVNVVAGDSHKNTETRRSLQPVVDLAVRIGAAALGVSHFSKGTAGRDPVERVTGSVAFGALPRIVFAAAKSTHEDAPACRLFVRSKSNIGPDGGGFGYDLEQRQVPGYPELQASCVLWGDPLTGQARELLATVETVEDRDGKSVLTEAEEWLRGLLKDEGQMDKREIMRLAQKNGFSERTVQRAREKLGVKSTSSGFGKDKHSLWKLPVSAQSCQSCQESVTQKRGTNGTNGESEPDEAREPEAF